MSTHSRCGKCVKCQIFGTSTTSNTKMMLYEICQISKIIQHSYSIVANLQRYGQMWQNFFIVLYSFSRSSPFIFSFLLSLTLRFPLFSLKPQSSPLKPQSVSLSPIPCFSRRRCPARPRRLHAHQDADVRRRVRRRVLRLRRFDPVAHRARFLLRPWLIALAFFFALAFNTIGWTDWAKAAIVPGLVSLIVGVICNGVRRGAVVVTGY